MRQSKYCNCSLFWNKEILKSNINYSFCDKCGSILIKDKEGNIFYTLKSNPNPILTYELNPINIIKNMKTKFEENYPFINEEFNINKSDIENIEKELNSINIYLNYRKKLLLTLQKLIIQFDYSDRTFYQCLFFLDTYLSHHLSDDISEQEFLYYLIGYFLCSLKFMETDAYIPSLNELKNIFNEFDLSSEKISYYEILCLKNINFNIFSYSAYDWIFQLINNGIVFNCEIENCNEETSNKGFIYTLINSINKYILTSLLSLTRTNLFFKYSPMYIALSLIQISREKFINKNMFKQELFFDLISIYGIKPNHYKKCYDEIESELKDIIYQENDNDINEAVSERNLNTINGNYENQKCLDRNNNNEELIYNKYREKEKFKSKLYLKDIPSRKKYKLKAKTIEKINKTIKPKNNISIKTSYNYDNSSSKKNDKTYRNELQQIRSHTKLFKSIEQRNLITNVNNYLPVIENKEKKEIESRNIKVFSHKNLYNIFKIESIERKNGLNSNKLYKIKEHKKFDFNKIRFNAIESNKTNKILNYKKNYKLKSIPNFIIMKETLPEDELKGIKD